MELYVKLYQNNPLFAGVEEDALLDLLQCLQASKRFYPKGSTIFASGEAATHLGIVLTGRINTVYENVLGDRSIMGTMEAGQLFCDAFCCTREQRMPVSVVAPVDSTVLLIDIKRVLHTCAHACKQHQRLSENLVHILAEKYVVLNQKLIHISARTTRQKLLSYLSERAMAAGGAPFRIPFNRQELADYLFIDRSGLSTEWSRLKREGILEDRGNGLHTLHGALL